MPFIELATVMNCTELHDIFFLQICGPQILNIFLCCYLQTQNNDLNVKSRALNIGADSPVLKIIVLSTRRDFFRIPDESNHLTKSISSNY